MTQKITTIAQHRNCQPIYMWWTKVNRPVLIYQEMRDWIDEHAGGRVVIGHTWIYYEYEADAVFFNLAHQGLTWNTVN